MSAAEVTQWLERYVAAWKSGDRDEIGELFAEDVRYRYHPPDEPLVGRDAVVESWLAEPDAPGSFDASYSCYAADGDAAVAVGTSTYLDSDGSIVRVYDNVFLLRFDQDGRCSEFTEWYLKRP
jgi:ketosteroid isomerase-like protein